MVASGTILDLSFALKVVQGGEVKEMPFKDLLTRPTVVSVYMKNKTPGCDRQNEALASISDALSRAGVGLVAVSRDTSGSHLRYAMAKGLSYPLVSDPTDLFARATDSLVKKSMYGRTFVGPARAAYLLDGKGRVLGVVAKVEPPTHAVQVNDLIKVLSGKGGV